MRAEAPAADATAPARRVDVTPDSAREGRAFSRNGPRRSLALRRRLARCDRRASDPDEPADRRLAERRAAVPAFRNSPRSAAAATRAIHQGRRRARRRRSRATRGDGVTFSLLRRLAAVALGTGLLVATVVGSGLQVVRLEI